VWRIYYADGAVFGSEDGDLRDAPRQGVLVIVQGDERVGWRWISGQDFYVYDAERGGWRETADFGMYDHLIRCREPLVLFGRWVDDETWHRIHKRVKEELGSKSGWLMTEDRRGRNT